MSSDTDTEKNYNFWISKKEYGCRWTWETRKLYIFWISKKGYMDVDKHERLENLYFVHKLR